MIIYLPVILGAVGLAAALLVYSMVLKYPAGEGKVVEIGDKIYRDGFRYQCQNQPEYDGF